MACLYLGGKVEDSPKSIRDVLVASCEIRYGEPARRLTHDKVRRLRGATLRVPTLCACTAAAAHRPIQSVLDLEANLGFQFPFQCHCSCRYKYIAACRPPNRPPVGAVRGTAGESVYRGARAAVRPQL